MGEYNTTTFITDGNGTVQGSQVNNVKYIHPASGQVNGGGDVPINTIPNYLATLNIRFEHEVPVQVQNWICGIYDRVNINNPASGVTCKVAELIQPSEVYSPGSGDTQWITPGGSGTVVPLAQSPGISGLYAGNGTNSVRADVRHDVYTILSASPDSIGSKTQFGLFCSLDYL